MPGYSKTDTLRSRLEQFPPFFIFALTKIKSSKLTKEQIAARFSNPERLKRKQRQWKGYYLRRKMPSRRMTRDEVAKRSGLHPRKVGRIAEKTTWEGVRVSDMLKFIEACNIDVLRLHSIKYQIKNEAGRSTPLRHLSGQQFSVFCRKAKKYQDGNEVETCV